ncbi:MAG: argininosuccinate lyase [Nitrososphaerales archaeon]
MSASLPKRYKTARARLNLRKPGDILHSGRLGLFSPSAAKYTSSIDIDQKLTSAVIAVNSAHVIMLSRQNIIDSDTAGKLLGALSSIPRNIELKEVLEDVHMNVEDYIISKIGKQVGGMLNLSKSRNDQVATALRIALREELISLGNSLVELQRSLLGKAEKHASSVMPGYTHLQRAQPVTVGHQLLAHYDALDRDFSRLVDCYLRVNISPMGSGALAGSSFNLDRELVADLLGFDSLLENTLDAVSSRDFATESIYVCAQTMVDLSRMSEEIILWTTKEFSFAEISDRYSSTSSMMPQKKNAIVPEIGRAKTSQVIADLVAALGIAKSLPLSYNLDLQELTRNLWSALEKTTSTLMLHAEMIAEMKFNEKVMLDAASEDDFLFATELADYLVRKHGMPFREAHGKVGSIVRYCSSVKRKQFSSMDESKIEELLGVPVTHADISQLTDPVKVLSRRRSTGYPNPRLVLKSCRERRKILARHVETLNALNDKILRSQSELEKQSRSTNYGGKKLQKNTHGEIRAEGKLEEGEVKR